MDSNCITVGVVCTDSNLIPIGVVHNRLNLTSVGVYSTDSNCDTVGVVYDNLKLNLFIYVDCKSIYNYLYIQWSTYISVIQSYVNLQLLVYTVVNLYLNYSILCRLQKYVQLLVNTVVNLDINYSIFKWG